MSGGARAESLGKNDRDRGSGYPLAPPTAVLAALEVRIVGQAPAGRIHQPQRMESVGIASPIDGSGEPFES
jgi:hypothetical protein